MTKEQFIQHSQQKIAKKMCNLLDHIDKMSTYRVYGCLVSAVGTTLEAYLPSARIGDLCKVFAPDDELVLLAEVMALNNHKVRLLPFGSIANLSQDAKIIRVNSGFTIGVGDFLLNKVVDGFGKILGAIDDSAVSAADKSASAIAERRSTQALAPDPFERPLISSVLVTGVKAIDLFNTCGVGQRIGIFAGPGIGKTTLMGMIIRNAQVDVVVVGLIGERGREVREFIELELGKKAAKRCVLVVATSDHSAVEQLKCAYTAQTIAEYFRDAGKKVLLFIDSITRFARAGREVGLSSGEPITRGGYPPSVFLSFPRLMERAGTTQQGSITAFYTVLMEAELASDDPIADEVKSILDGHILLSRKLAELGQFPAIDILKSLSRVADRIITEKHLLALRHIRLLMSKYEDLEFLIRVGEYKRGQDALADQAIDKHKSIIELLKQQQQTNSDFTTSIENLIQLAQRK
jgi:ATP synthase in type III secretion protein N